MEIWQAIVLGAVQGFSEFLPISSSGHLILLEKLFGIKDNALFYSVMLHVGTLVPVIIILFDKLKGLFVKPFSLLKNLIIATIPAGIMGLIATSLVDLDKLFFDHTWLLSVAFIVTAILLFCSEKVANKSLKKPLDSKSALMMGIGQMVGIFPGISRSGATMSFGCFSKVDNVDNADFTFIMSLPIIISAVILSTFDLVKGGGIGDISVLPLLLGMVTSAVCGYVAISFMMKLIKKMKFSYFSIYLILLSIVTFFI